jgi:hypothetical protein
MATMTAWVTSTAPLLVIVAGADTACPAAVISGLSLSVDDKVTIELRTPQQPLINAVELEAPS